MTDQENLKTVIQNVRSEYVPCQAYREVMTLIKEQLEQRRDDIEFGDISEPEGIAIIGESRSGKTRLMRQVMEDLSDEMAVDRDKEVCELISLKLASPATLKSVGNTTLRALGYPLISDNSAAQAWDLVRKHLMQRQTLFLHYDEAQDFGGKNAKNELEDVTNTFKSLMENDQWQVNLILSGTPALGPILNSDVQLSSRFSPVTFGALVPEAEEGEVLFVLEHYANIARLPLADDVKTEDFARRLMHSSAYAFGRLAQTVVRTTVGLLRRKGFDGVITRADFADYFRKKWGAIDGLNPFITEDFHRINVNELNFGDDD